jgi:hypothetical protein
MKNKYQILLSFLVIGVAVSLSYGGTEKKDPALQRTRKQVRMLDDIYKTAVVLITSHYVNDEDDLPAGSAAIALFDAIKKKGWHEVRLLDASGEPIEEKNTARDEFEKTAVARLLAGESYYDMEVQKDGTRYLRAATPIPVVLQKCTMCHDNYRKAKKGEPIGALSYTLPIE